MSRKFWIYFLIGGSAISLLYFIGLPAQWVRMLFFGFGVACFIAMLVGYRVNRPYPAPVWILVCVGQLINCLGNFFFTWNHLFTDPALPEIAFSICYLCVVVCWQAAMVLLLVRFRKVIGREALLHGLIVATALLTVIWMVYFDPQMGKKLNGWVEFGDAGYAIGLFGIGVMGSILLMSRIGRTWSYRFVFLSLLCYIPGLILYNIVEANPTQVFLFAHIQVITACDLTYSVAYLLLGLALLHPSIQNLQNPLPDRNTMFNKADILFVSGAFGSILVAFLNQYFHQEYSGAPVAILGMTIIFILVVLRLAQIVKVLEVQNHLLSRQQAQLHHQANYDTLTNLPNRNYLYRFLDNAVQHLKSTSGCSAVFMIDLNCFKQVNDTYGHDQGDLVLQTISDQMMQLKRKGDLVVRWGGDEFVFVLGDLKNQQDALAFARRLTQEVRVNITGDGQPVSVTLSIGIDMFTQGQEEIDVILKKADVALYHAKGQNVDKIAFYQDADYPY